MRRLASACLAGLVLGLAAMMPTKASAQTIWAGLPSFQAIDAGIQARALGRGINILSHDPFFDADQGAHFKDRYFRTIVAAGFRTVRIPQAVYRHIDAEGRIDPVWLAKLDRVVRLATLNGLNVIIDNNNDRHCTDQGQACLDLNARAWANLARHYRQAPATVLFELYNEPEGAITPDMWNAGLAKLLAAVRASNPDRNVLIGPAHSYNPRDLAELVLPDSDHHLIATFHYYEPFSFTHQGGAWLPPERRPPLGARFGTPAEIADLDRTFDYVAAWSTWVHRPVFLGEFGALDTADAGDRVLWTRLVARAAEQRGFSWAYWQFDGDFTVYDTVHDAWVAPVLCALIPDCDNAPFTGSAVTSNHRAKGG